MASHDKCSDQRTSEISSRRGRPEHHRCGKHPEADCRADPAGHREMTRKRQTGKDHQRQSRQALAPSESAIKVDQQRGGEQPGAEPHTDEMSPGSARARGHIAIRGADIVSMRAALIRRMQPSRRWHIVSLVPRQRVGFQGRDDRGKFVDNIVGRFPSKRETSSVSARS